MTKTPTYPIPDAALDDRLGWVGTSGSGKTYNSASAVERLIARGARVVVVDPLDVWWGLRLKADGSPSALNIPIFGGAHGDLPLTEHAGALIGETAATMAESCIVSLGGLTTKASERRFMLAFLDAIYRNADPSRSDPFHIVFDEADLWAPQRTTEPMLQSRMEEIVRRGRVKGFIPWLITQRPAILSKDVLSQVDGLVAFKLTSSQDRDAIGAWIEGQADRVQGKEILASLPTMQRGQGVVWVPGRAILDIATFPPKATFDSSRTPKRGERRERRDLKPLNLEKLKGRLTSIEEETKANDPRALKAEVARLGRELAKAQRAAVKHESVPDTCPPPRPAAAEEIEQARLDGERAGIAIGLTRAQQAVLALRVDGEPQQPLAARLRRARGDSRTTAPAPAPVADPPPAAGITGPQQRILDSLAWWRAFGINAPANEQVAFIARYSPNSTGYTNPRGALKMAGLVSYPSGGAVALTDAGAEKANAPDAPPTREEMHRRIMERLSGPQQRILEPLLKAHPDMLTNERLASEAGYSERSTGYTNPRGSLKMLGLVEYPANGCVRAQDWLFP